MLDLPTHTQSSTQNAPHLCLDGIEVREFVQPGNEQSQSFHIGYNRSSVEQAQNSQSSLRFWCVKNESSPSTWCHIMSYLYYILQHIFEINAFTCSCHVVWLISSHPDCHSASRNLDCAMNSPGLVWDPVRMYGPGSLQTSAKKVKKR